MQLLDNIKDVYRIMTRAALKYERDPGDITLIAVSKTVPVEIMQETIDIGLRNFGESRVQEAQNKIPLCCAHDSYAGLAWHLIGHLQKNKAKTAVQLFDVIHSVDSLELAEIIDRHAKEAGKKQRILVQVKLSDEDSKRGIIKENAVDKIKKIAGLDNIKVEGLMTIPPYTEEPEDSRPFFRELKRLKDEIQKKGIQMRHLSMGMSHDFEVAIAEGATMVRVGTALFGERRRG